jgi:DNA-binding transcriptional MerR regulator
MEESMRISELAKVARTTIESIRFYEAQGLLPRPDRSRNNYRRYGQEHVERLHLIRSYRALDISLDEIRQLLVWTDSQTVMPGHMEQVLQEHILKIEQRIDQLSGLKAYLIAQRRIPPVATAALDEKQKQ